MIVKLEYDDRGIVGVRTDYRGKLKNQYIRLIVDERTILPAMTNPSKWLVALDYVGDISHLHEFKNVIGLPVIVSREFVEVSETELDFLMTQIPKWVVVAIKVPKGYNDMRFVKQMSDKHKNIRFCGGNFVRLLGCNTGCIMRQDIKDGVPETKIQYVTVGCACILPSMHIEDVHGAEILYADTELEKVKKKQGQIEVIKGVTSGRSAATLADLII